MSGSKTEIPADILAEASRWLIDLNDNPDDAQCRNRFERWLCLSPDHRRAWERMQIVWGTLDATTPAYDATWKNAPRTPQQKRARSMRHGFSGYRRLVAGLAAASLCLALVIGPDAALRLQSDYRTETAQSRSVTLEDGSVVHLSGASAIATDFSGASRKVRLMAGGAYFEVAPDKTRPFTVTADGVDITVLGTKFDVHMDGGITAVALAEGSVQADITGKDRQRTEILAPGDMLTANRATGAVERTTVPVDEIAGWRNGQIFVVNATIGSVVQQIGRYHPAWLSLPDRTLANQRVTGFYNLSDPDQALKALVGPFGGTVRHISPAARLISRF